MFINSKAEGAICCKYHKTLECGGGGGGRGGGECSKEYLWHTTTRICNFKENVSPNFALRKIKLVFMAVDGSNLTTNYENKEEENTEPDCFECEATLKHTVFFMFFFFFLKIGKCPRQQLCNAG